MIIVMVAGGAAASTTEQSARLYQLGVWQRLQSATFFFFSFFFLSSSVRIVHVFTSPNPRICYLGSC